MNTIPIPVDAGKHISEMYGYDQVIIIARKVGDREHVTTYGVTKEHCSISANIGDFIKYKIMKWEMKPVCNHTRTEYVGADTWMCSDCHKEF